MNDQAVHHKARINRGYLTDNIDNPDAYGRALESLRQHGIGEDGYPLDWPGRKTH